ncbi:phospholipase A1-like [Anthonomus grandis grandis]|uniref:phospholipase A1-like n=1 Tax=Anthonomus grandis grandis TaxID=2921223 RepID=UPI002165F39C|nr:phospholipase A1-like [Anthonomus grandis grandis]
MRALLVFSAVLAITVAKSVITDIEEVKKLVKDPRYLVYENEEGLYEVEDLEAEAEPFNPELRINDNQIIFHVFSRQDTRGAVIRASQVRDITRLTSFTNNRNTVLIIHGWTNHAHSPVNVVIRESLIAHRDVNIIVVDWNTISSESYLTAQRQVLAVGNFIGDFLIRLNNEVGHSVNRVTLVGHSLGAHISGNAGARCNGLVDSIVGLDPAGPLFTENNINNRLDPTDARYVQILHTNDGLLGFNIRMGHTDFYPNGGSTQPGCGVDITGSCAHARAYDYYAESIATNRFVSRSCGNYNDFLANRCNGNVFLNMGNWPVNRGASGKYYLMTNNRAPFAQG